MWQGRHGVPARSRTEMAVPPTAPLLPQRQPKSARMVICRRLSGDALGCRCVKGSQQPQTPQCNGGRWARLVDAGGACPAPCLPPARLQAGSAGAPRGPPRPPAQAAPRWRDAACCLRLGHVSLASEKVRKFFLFFFFFSSFFPPQDFIPSRSSRPGRRHLCTSSSEACRLRAVFSTVLRCSVKGSLCLGWDKGTSLIKLA